MCYARTRPRRKVWRRLRSPPRLPREGERRGGEAVIDGKTELPKPQQPRASSPIIDPDFALDTGKATLGQSVYGAKCVICHGLGAVAGGYAPDLRASPVPLSVEGFSDIVREGALKRRGMPGFSELTNPELEAMRHYIRKRARDAVAKSL